MPATLSVHAIEESTYIITLAFTDEDGDPVVPTMITWTLSNTTGTVVNSRLDVAIAVPAASVDVLLQGDDLQILSGEVNQGVRTFTVEATYLSLLGADLPLNASVRFIVDNLLMIT